MNDLEAVLTFARTRCAIAGEETLLAAGVKVRVMSRPAALGDGCGISLRVAAEERERAVRILREAKVEVEEVYLKRLEGGDTKYWLLE